MTELIKITTNNEGSNVVLARELYQYLALDKTNLSRWMKNNIVENPYFTENEDWEGLVFYDEGNNKLIDYYLTLMAAKKIAMTCKSEKGNKVRDYFIECEKELLRPKQLTTLEIIRIAEKAELARLEAEQKVENLTIALDSSLEWCSIIKCATYNLVHESVFKWQILKNKSIELGYGIKKLPSTRYIYQNAYHVNVFRACYPQYRYDFLNQTKLLK